MPISASALVAAIRDHVRRAERRQTSAAVVAAIQRSHGAPRWQIRDAITRLLKNQDLVYSYELGCSFLVENTLQPWQASPRIWIAPPQCALPKELSADAVFLRLQAGAAFGSDGHPTTRLCLLALDWIFSGESQRCCFGGAAIDIGTGSGILAIAASLFGCSSVVALDTDPCAREEAAYNAALNRCQSKVRVEGTAFEACDDIFHLIMANLRFPTLVRLLPWAAQHLDREGRIVVSGYLREEAASLEELSERLGLTRCWDEEQKRWRGAVLHRRGLRA